MDLWERRLLQSDATTEARELLIELLDNPYSCRKMQEELVLLGAGFKTASYISLCFASRERTQCHRLRVRVRDAILRERVRPINIPQRHIRVSLVPRPLFCFYVGFGYRD